MKWEESCHRRYAMQPMVTMLREHRSVEMTAITDMTAPPGPEPARAAPQANATLTPKTRGLGRVLVVDDDEVIRRLIAANLTLEGFDVATAVDGQDCLEKATAIAPDVITLDVTMPRLDGWETAFRLRNCPDTSHIKVVLITARDQAANPTRHRHADADAYLTKPFDPGEMIRVVRELAGVTGARGLGSSIRLTRSASTQASPSPPAAAVLRLADQESAVLRFRTATGVHRCRSPSCVYLRGLC
jgi:CheY-like chemotaxis protein